MPKRSSSTRNTKRSTSRSSASRRTAQNANLLQLEPMTREWAYSETKQVWSRLEDLTENEQEFLLPIDTFVMQACPEARIHRSFLMISESLNECLLVVPDFVGVPSFSSRFKVLSQNYGATLERVESSDELYETPVTYILLFKLGANEPFPGSAAA